MAGRTDFDAVGEDIAQQSTDVLVDAAGTGLQMGSGVAGALGTAADGPMPASTSKRAPVSAVRPSPATTPRRASHRYGDEESDTVTGVATAVSAEVGR